MHSILGLSFLHETQTPQGAQRISGCGGVVDAAGNCGVAITANFEASEDVISGEINLPAGSAGGGALPVASGIAGGDALAALAAGFASGDALVALAGWVLTIMSTNTKSESSANVSAGRASAECRFEQNGYGFAGCEKKYSEHYEIYVGG